jgi:hypothetical protein
MIGPRFFFLLLFAAAVGSFAQPLQISDSQLDFGVTNELSASQRAFFVKNTQPVPVVVSGFRWYNTYSAPAFSAPVDSFTLAPGDSFQVEVSFLPRHNIVHNSELVLMAQPGGQVAIDLRGQGRYSKTYYSTTENLKQEALKTALKARLAQGYTSLSYNAARDAMFMTIDNKKENGEGATQNTLECLYTGRIIDGYANRTDAQLMNFNTEHVFPQGFFNQQLPERSDIFHLYPTWEPANSARGSLPFGIVSGNATYQDGGSKGNSSVFEPRDDAKGRVARSMLYFATRYGNYASFLTNQENLLRQWAANFPPDLKDTRRNDAIFAVQNNRNPYIDYPAFLERITSLSSNSTETAVYSVDIPADTIRFGLFPTGDTALYQWVMVNDGNQPVNLTGFGSPFAGLLLPALPDTVSLAPGEAFSLPLALTLADSGTFSTTLNFRGQLANNQFTASSVPIVAKSRTIPTTIDPVRGELQGWNTRLESSVLHLFRKDLSGGVTTVELTDLHGRRITRFSVPSGSVSWQEPIPALASGLYQLKISQKGAAVFRKVKAE